MMPGKYNNEEAIGGLVRAFESGTVRRGDWGHAEHLVVAVYYLRQEGVEAATVRMRDGIFNLLRNGFKIDLSREMPYHETLTVFWMKVLDELLRSKDGASLPEVAGAAIEAFDKDHPLKFYTRERLFSEEARREYVPPDRDGSQTAGGINRRDADEI